jgi:hypothetical protein
MRKCRAVKDYLPRPDGRQAGVSSPESRERGDGNGEVTTLFLRSASSNNGRSHPCHPSAWPGGGARMEGAWGRWRHPLDWRY